MIRVTTKNVVFASIIIRTLSAFIQKTWFVPDEHWQSVEVAHHLVFGYGHLTWEWKVGIRSYIYPLIISFLYKLLQMTSLDNVYLLTLIPRLFHAGLAVICDLYTFWLAKLEFGHDASFWAVFLNLSSWFMFYCMSRTLINSVETVLIVISIYYFCYWYHKHNYRKWPVAFVISSSIAFMIRPTSAILIFPLILCQIHLSKRYLFHLHQCYCLIGSAILLLTVLIDRLCFGAWVIVPYNFVKFNIIHGLGTFYGSHPWYWYFTHGLPTVLGTHIIPVFFGVNQMKKHLFSVLILWTLFVYSLLGHKEFRFILPMLPLAICLAARFLSTVCNKFAAIIIGMIAFTNLFPATYFSLWHQRGPIDLMSTLSTQVHQYGEHNMQVLFLMPCHSTPYYSHIHHNISMRFLSCEPQLDDHIVVDEAELFYSDPQKWLSSYLLQSSPSHIVMYNCLQSTIHQLLLDNHLSEYKHIFHAHISEGRIGSHIVIYRTNPLSSH